MSARPSRNELPAPFYACTRPGCGWDDYEPVLVSADELRHVMIGDRHHWICETCLGEFRAKRQDQLLGAFGEFRVLGGTLADALEAAA